MMTKGRRRLLRDLGLTIDRLRKLGLVSELGAARLRSLGKRLDGRNLVETKRKLDVALERGLAINVKET
jgi:hypothetical protein